MAKKTIGSTTADTIVISVFASTAVKTLETVLIQARVMFLKSFIK